MNAQARVIGVEFAVAGFATVEEPELKKKLGHAAWVVWQLLCTRRDRQGVLTITIAAISQDERFETFKPRVVRKALERLRKAGLVEDVRAVWNRTPQGEPYRTFIRRIRGAKQLSIAGAERVSVPEETKLWMTQASSHGGPRMGAGRKNSRGAASDSRGAASAPPGRIQEGLTLNHVPIGTGSEVVRKTSPYGEVTRRPETGSAGVLQEISVEGVGVGFTGGAKRSGPLPSTPLKGLPPYPGWSVVAPAQVPPPPKLKPEDSEDYKVRLLAAAFRGAVEQEYKVKCYLLANVSPKAPSYRVLAAAVKLFEQFDVAPAQWCIYAVRRWYLARTHTNGWTKGMPVPLPPVGVIFGKKQITEKLADAKSHDAVVTHAAGGRAIFGKTHKALIVRYQELRTAITRGHSIAEAMALFFPGTSYEDMLEAAKLEAVEIRNRLDFEISKGKMVWG